MALRRSTRLRATARLRVDGFSPYSVGLVGTFDVVGVVFETIPLDLTVPVTVPEARRLDADGETTMTVPLVDSSVPVEVPTSVVLGLSSVRSDTTDGSVAAIVPWLEDDDVVICFTSEWILSHSGSGSSRERETDPSVMISPPSVGSNLIRIRSSLIILLPLDDPISLSVATPSLLLSMMLNNTLNITVSSKFILLRSDELPSDLWHQSKATIKGGLIRSGAWMSRHSKRCIF